MSKWFIEQDKIALLCQYSREGSSLALPTRECWEGLVHLL